MVSATSNLRAGNFSEDSRGRWYLNVCVPGAQRVGDERNKPSVESILDRSVPSLGIDLGLKTFAAFSDEALPPIEAERFYRDLEPRPGPRTARPPSTTDPERFTPRSRIGEKISCTN